MMMNVIAGEMGRKCGGSSILPAPRKDFREKEFVLRNSLLTDLFAISHINTIYNIAIVVLIVFALNTAVQDLRSTGTVQLGLKLIWCAFGGFHRGIAIWLVMFLSVCLAYACFSLWAGKRQQLSSPAARRCWDGAATVALISYYAALVVLPCYWMQRYDMKIASTFSVCCECVRLLMKTHAFVRSNAPRALILANSKAKPQPYPSFAHFLYFMFAPTLIYRDTYPRTREVRWRLVAYYALEVACLIFYLSFICERYMLPLYQDFGREPPTLMRTLEVLAGGMLPSGVTIVWSFYFLLHSWHNAFAEILRFGDRLFYKDWWNQNSFSSFYRTWNMIVQDWLFIYVFNDVRLLGGSSFMAKFTVFGISAAAHEFILSFTFGFFFPVLYFLFGVLGTIFAFVNHGRSKAIGNIFLWLCLLSGSSVMFGSYSMEHFARQNCARLVESKWDLVIPRCLNCVPVYQAQTET